jgi:hypothetical protein
MIELILRDADLRPDLFKWRGKLSISELERWEREHSVPLPKDLKQLWSIRGGGDLFESETVLQPFGAAEYDLISSVSETFWKRGLHAESYVFHTGLWDSVFQKSDGTLSSLESTDLSRKSKFQDLDDWYKALRAEYAERYGLVPLE